MIIEYGKLPLMKLLPIFDEHIKLHVSYCYPDNTGVLSEIISRIKENNGFCWSEQYLVCSSPVKATTEKLSRSLQPKYSLVVKLVQKL